MTEEEMNALLSYGIGANDRPLDLASLDRDMEFLFMRSNDETGKQLTRHHLDSGLRTSAELREEAELNELTLRIADQPDKNGVQSRLLKMAFKVNALIFWGPYVVVERARTFLRRPGQPTIPTRKFRGPGGTMQRGESPMEAMIRELEQEICKTFRPDDLYVHTEQSLLMRPLHRDNWRESSVYKGIVAIDIPHQYQIYLHDKPWDQDEWQSPPDRGVIVHFGLELADKFPIARDNLYRRLAEMT